MQSRLKCTEMPHESDLELLQNAFTSIREQLAKAIVSQDAVIEQMMIALLAKGHCLYEGPAGAAKSLVAAAVVGTPQILTPQQEADLMSKSGPQHRVKMMESE